MDGKNTFGNYFGKTLKNGYGKNVGEVYMEENKRIIMVGFFTQDLKDLIEHLEITGCSEKELNHLKEILNESTSSTY